MKNTNKINNLKPASDGEKISRKEALQKAGLVAFSAATMMLLVNNPAKAQDDDSPDIAPDW